MFQPSFTAFFLIGAMLFANLCCTSLTAPQIASNRQSRIELTPCSSTHRDPTALCAKYPVYEDRGAKSGRTIALNILILPATSAAAKADAVFFLAGGPGQSASAVANSPESALFAELRRQRDLVFVDLRGTGNSHRLACAAPMDHADEQNYFGEIFEPSSIHACRDTLERFADLRQYSTANAMDDLEEVRAALGYDKINLYGVSYGTLAALEYLRRYPERVRAAAIAGVLTPAAKLPLHFAQGAELALERLFEDCAADESCGAKFPELRGDFNRALAGFDRGPVTFELDPPVSKIRQTVSLSRGVFTERVRAMLHGNGAARLIPLLVHDAAEGKWSTFAKIAAAFITPSAFGIAIGVYYSVTCGESVPAIGEDDIRRESQNTFLGDYRTRRHQQACRIWPRAALDADHDRPIASNAPILMLSGDVDPATPMSLGKEALKYLPNARQIILPNTPHSYTSECARGLMVEFILRGGAADLNTSCAARLRRPPFVSELPGQNS